MTEYDQTKSSDQSTEDSQAECLRNLKSEFKLDHKHFMVWWNKKREWEKFYDGDQLSEEEKSALKQRGQPEVVINLIKPRIDGSIGDFLGRRVMMRAKDRGTGDFQKARFITEALRYVEDQNKFDRSETKVAEQLLIGGCGWYKAGLEFDFLEPEIKISFRNNNDVFVDRRCRRPDMKDAKQLWETVWVEKGDLIDLYPDYKDKINDALAISKETWNNTTTSSVTAADEYASSENAEADSNEDWETFVDEERKRLRLINGWQRIQKKVEFAFHPKLEAAVVEVSKFDAQELSDFKKIYPGAEYFTRVKWELNSTIFIDNCILEEKKNVRPYDSEGKFPFARAVGSMEHDTFIPYGLVKQYIDPQKEYNKRRSKLLHKTNVNQILAEEGAIAREEKEQVRAEAARPDGFIIYKAGKAFSINKAEPSQSDVFLLQLSQGEIEGVGVSKESIGTESKDLSGKAIQLRQVSGKSMMRAYFAALRDARRDIFSIVLEEMQQWWTSQKLIKISDDQQAGEIVLNQRVPDPNSGKTIILNDLRLGKYDIKIDEDAESANQRQENFVSLMQLAQPIMQSGQPFPIEILIDASDLPKKLEVIQAITAEKQRQLAIAQANAQQAQAQAVIAAAGAAHAERQKGQSNVSPTSSGG